MDEKQLTTYEYIQLVEEITNTLKVFKHSKDQLSRIVDILNE